MKAMKLYEKLHHIQTQIMGFEKDKATYNYRYVTGDKVLKYIKPLMNELGLILKQEILSIDNERMDYTTAKGVDKSEILSKVMMRFTWVDVVTGDVDENLFGANGQNDWEKGLGSALTYAERYFLLKFFHIPTDEDDIDNELRKTANKIVAPKEPEQSLEIDSKQWKALEASLAQGTSFSLSQIRKKYKVSKDVATELSKLGVS